MGHTDKNIFCYIWRMGFDRILGFPFVMKDLIPIIAGAVLGIVTWKFSAYSADFGLGPLIWILICTVGGWYTWGK
jgi:hypothetical protein